jgi:chorismate-pyruvate lyase
VQFSSSPTREESTALTDDIPANGSLPRLADLLTSFDGSVTALLKSLCGEEILVAAVSQETIALPPTHILRLAKVTSALKRDVILTSSSRSKQLVAASSYIAIERMPARVQLSLRAGNKPIGRILCDERVEVFREVVQHRYSPRSANISSDMNAYFERTSHVWSGSLPLVVITEQFSDECLSLL